MCFRRIEQRQARKEPALEIGEQALVPGPFNFGCDPAIFLYPGIMLRPLSGSAGPRAHLLEIGARHFRIRKNIVVIVAHGGLRSFEMARQKSAVRV
jgi:hypothetical protein